MLQGFNDLLLTSSMMFLNFVIVDAVRVGDLQYTVDLLDVLLIVFSNCLKETDSVYLEYQYRPSTIPRIEWISSTYLLLNWT